MSRLTSPANWFSSLSIRHRSNELTSEYPRLDGSNVIVVAPEPIFSCVALELAHSIMMLDESSRTMQCAFRMSS
jgi:hypothetical protein